MISVLILDGFYDSTMCQDIKIIEQLSDIYVPLLLGILRFNGIQSTVVKPNGLQYAYSLNGHTNENLIYVPSFECSKSDGFGISLIFADSTDSASVSFRVASKLRKYREDTLKKIVFVNKLHENDVLKNYSPVIVDKIRFDKDMHLCDSASELYFYALSTAFSICEYYGIIFRNPAEQK